MHDYQPLDISSVLNAGIEVLGEDDQDVDVGSQSFRGLPFEVGTDSGGDCFISLDVSSGPIKIDVGESAHRVVFAHRLVGSEIDSGGSVGLPVAEYVFHMASGKDFRANIRERFEIASVPNDSFRGPSGLPFQAVTDQKHTLFERDQGKWEELGRRQTEYAQASARSYFLWAWTNPEPESVIESIEIVPQGAKFIIAGVTLGREDEHPFARQGRRETRITVTDETVAGQPFDLSVKVDRGDTTFVFPLPKDPDSGFIDAYHKGYGQEDNPDSDSAYAEISAVPSATVIVKQGDEEVGQVKWGEVEREGVVETPRMKIELLDKGRNWVNVDDDTGRPVPCRVHFRSPEGIPYQPHGHHNQVNSNLGTWHIDIGGDVRLGQISYAYIDGTCQGWLPRGDVIVDVARGFEYEPLRTRVSIEPGQQELTL